MRARPFSSKLKLTLGLLRRPNDLALLKPLDKPILEAFLAAVRYEAHLAYQREVHRVLTESVFGSLLFDESDLERHAPSTMAQLPASKHPRFWYEGVEAYFDHTAVKVFPQELQKSMQSWLSTDWYQEHMAETLERAAKRFAEDWLYPVSMQRLAPSSKRRADAFPFLSREQGDDKQCLCTLNGNPETFTRLETARKTYDALCDAVQRPSSIVAADCASLHRDVQEEIAEGTRTSDFWSKGGWAEPLDRAAALGFVRLSQVLAEEEKAGRLNWIEQYDGVVKVLRHVGGVLIYHSVASSPMLDHEGRRRIGDVDDFAAWVSVALEQRELNAESAVLLEDMVSLPSLRLYSWLTRSHFRAGRRVLQCRGRRTCPAMLLAGHRCSSHAQVSHAARATGPEARQSR